MNMNTEYMTFQKQMTPLARKLLPVQVVTRIQTGHEQGSSCVAEE